MVFLAQLFKKTQHKQGRQPLLRMHCCDKQRRVFEISNPERLDFASEHRFADREQPHPTVLPFELVALVCHRLVHRRRLIKSIHSKLSFAICSKLLYEIILKSHRIYVIIKKDASRELGLRRLP